MSVTVDRQGRVYRQLPSGRIVLIGHVLRVASDRPAGWRAITDGGGIVARGLSTRREALAALEAVA